MPLEIHGREMEASMGARLNRISLRSGRILILPFLWHAEAATAEPLLEALGGEISTEFRFEAARQYDFWIGEWRANWRFRVPDEFFNARSGAMNRHWVFPVLDGKALVEIVRGERPNSRGFLTQGCSIRYFDTEKQRWVMAQNWPAPNTTHAFMDQLQGFLEENRIQVFSASMGEDGATSVRRYIFSDIGTNYFRWESAVTQDHGQTWRAGTIVHFHRTGTDINLGRVGDALPDSPGGGAWTDDGFRVFESMQGGWIGVRREPDGAESRASLVVAGMQNGGSVIGILSHEAPEGPARSLHLWTFGTQSRTWIELRLDNEVATPHTYLVGAHDENGHLVLEENAGLRIQDELTPRPQPPLRPDAPLARTIWTEIGADRLTFEHQHRDAPDDEWETTVSFELRRSE